MEDMKTKLLKPEENKQQTVLQQSHQKRVGKGTSVPSITLPELIPPSHEGQIPSTSRKTNYSTNTNTSRRNVNPINDDDDDDGHVVPLSSIRKSASQTPRITPHITPKQTPRYTPRVLQIQKTVRGVTQLLNSADILSLAEKDESLIDSTDLAQPNNESHVSSHILLGDDDSPDLSDI